MSSYSIGDKLIIHLKSGDVIEGLFIDNCNGVIDVSDVVDHSSGVNLGDSFTFRLDEIINISIIQSNADDSTSNLENESNNRSSNNKNKILLTEEEYVRLKQVTFNNIYHATFDNNYYNGTKYLNSCETLSMRIFKANDDRATPISLLVLASWEEVHIFDLQMYNCTKLPPELLTILETDEIKKVVYDVRPVVDCFQHHYQITLKNLYDIKIADAVITTREQGAAPNLGRTLTQCLEHYLNLPKSMIENALNVKSSEWCARPLNSKHKVFASQLVVYLITLKNLTEKLLLKDFYDVMNAEIKSISEVTPVKALSALKNLTLSENAKDALTKLNQQ